MLLWLHKISFQTWKRTLGGTKSKPVRHLSEKRFGWGGSSNTVWNFRKAAASIQWFRQFLLWMLRGAGKVSAGRDRVSDLINLRQFACEPMSSWPPVRVKVSPRVHLLPPLTWRWIRKFPEANFEAPTLNNLSVEIKQLARKLISRDQT